MRVALLALALVCACGHVTRTDYFPGWQISSRVTPPNADLLRTGHLLVRGPGSVLTLEYNDGGTPLVIDSAVCHIVRIALPEAPRPGVIEHPLAYDEICGGCAIGPFREEALTRGRVTVRQADARSVEAELDLEFPSSQGRDLRGVDPVRDGHRNDRQRLRAIRRTQRTPSLDRGAE